MMTRRQAIKTTALVAGAMATAPGALAQEPPSIKLSQPLITPAASGTSTDTDPHPYEDAAISP